jgi:hypothetical protein
MRRLRSADGADNEAVSAIRALADLIPRDPEALIRGRPAGPME